MITCKTRIPYVNEFFISPNEALRLCRMDAAVSFSGFIGQIYVKNKNIENKRSY